MDKSKPAFLLSFFIGWEVFFFSCKDKGNPVDTGVALEGKIVFASSKSGLSHIYVVNADGSGLRQLTSGNHYEAMPRWSPDGKRIVFVSDSLATSLGGVMYLMDADGSRITPVKEFPPPIPGAPPFYQPGNSPAWSPDGKKIAFSWCVDCELFGINHEIFVVDLTTDAMTRLTIDQASDTEPAWSPDGMSIVFVSNRDFASQHMLANELYIINQFGANPQRLTVSDSGVTNYSPRWSQDSIRIAYVRYSAVEMRSNLYFLNVQNLFTRRITNFKLVGSPAWSPDGRYLALNYRDENDTFVTAILDDAGSLVSSILLNDPTAKDFDWSVR